MVFHYGVVWIAFTDLLVVNLPKNKRYWWNIFRAVQGIQIAWLTAALWINELDDPEDSITIARIVLSTIRFIWGAVDCYRYGPWLDHWLCFLHERRQIHKTMKAYEYLVYGHLAFVVILFILPHLFNLTMWTYDVAALNGPIVGCLATHAFSVFVKWFTLETQAENRGSKAAMALFMVLLFVIQWFLYIDLYTHDFPDMRLPYVHSAGETFFLTNALLYVYDWCKHK